MESKGCLASTMRKSTKYEKGKKCIMHDTKLRGVVLSVMGLRVAG
jgi:hypothetical protein